MAFNNGGGSYGKEGGRESKGDRFSRDMGGYGDKDKGGKDGKDKDGKKRRRKAPPKEVVCPYDEKTLDAGLDYKAIGFISKFRSSQGKILSRKRTGLNKQYQKKLAIALKRARFMGLLGFIEI